MDDLIRRRKKLDALEQDARRAWCCEYSEDKEFILSALKSPTLPPKADFECLFPNRLKNDKEVVLGFCARSDFYEQYEEGRYLCVPEYFSNDKDVMLAYCQKIPQALNGCSDQLRDNRDVVLAAVQRDGMELQFASWSLREDRDIIVAACQNCTQALRCCTPPVFNELVRDREFMLWVFRQGQGGGRMIKLVPEPFRNDRLLLLGALKHGMKFRDCPLEYQMDRGFIVEALTLKATLYLELNRDAKDVTAHEAAYAAIVSITSTADVQRHALKQFPELRSCREVALAICEKGEVADVQQYIAEDCPSKFKNDCDIMRKAIQRDSKLLVHVSLQLKRDSEMALAICEHGEVADVRQYISAGCPIEFKNDREIMRKAIGRDSKLLVHASPQLKQDTEIIEAAVDKISAKMVLAALGHVELRQNPQIVVRAISVYPWWEQLVKVIPEEMWMQHRPLAVAIIMRNGIMRNGLVAHVFEHMLQTDQELALLVAAHAWLDFSLVGDSLKNDLKFMNQAVDRNGLVLRFASSRLQQMVDLVIRAVANHPRAIAYTNSAAASTTTTNSHRWNSEQVMQVIRQKLDLHQLFVNEFLRGITNTRPHLPPSQQSSLPMLDRGLETSKAFKLLIAEFLGVPIGAELKRLRKAFTNLTQPVSEHANRITEAQMHHLVSRQVQRRLRMAGAGFH